MQKELKQVVKNDQISIYELNSSNSNCSKIIASTPYTRSICNDTTIAGIDYTDRLKESCASIFSAYDFGLKEQETVVVNILRGSLNFGLREALHKAYGWTHHNTSFISAQRARNSKNSEEWHITESGYQKVYFPSKTSLVIGDVVATGTSLQYGLDELISCAIHQKVDLKSIVFFTYGGKRAESILCEIDELCRMNFPSYEHTYVVYLEGQFTVPDTQSPLTIRLTGTDLLRRDAIMAPEFIESQYENPIYPLERCVIYDAGSRAFWIPEYINDVINYWKQTLELTQRGVSFNTLLKERFPELDTERFETVDLRQLVLNHLKQLEQLKNK